MQDLTLRLQRLEDIEAIRNLKARYFHACDHKDITTLRDCFVAGPLTIDYGAIGQFADREAFLAIYEQMACHAHIIDMHHGQNAQIQWRTPDEASARWDLFFHQINNQAATLTQLAGFYEDRYVKQDGDWKIGFTRFQVTSTLVTTLDAGQPQVVFAGSVIA